MVGQDDFELLAQGGRFLNEEGEFDHESFRLMIHEELRRYARRQLTNRSTCRLPSIRSTPTA
eukprot:161434-Hanusia_phi.AAC.1